MTGVDTGVWKAAIVALKKALYRHLPDKAYKTTQTRLFTWTGVQVNRRGQEPL
jgi:hypothetical protein